MILEQDVHSTMISKVKYNEEEKILTVIFAKGGSYEYKDVPRIVYNDLISANSAGKYLLSNVKDKFETERI